MKLNEKGIPVEGQQPIVYQLGKDAKIIAIAGCIVNLILFSLLAYIHKDWTWILIWILFPIEAINFFLNRITVHPETIEVRNLFHLRSCTINKSDIVTVQVKQIKRFRIKRVVIKYMADGKSHRIKVVCSIRDDVE